jgi:hypothetical protein
VVQASGIALLKCEQMRVPPDSPLSAIGFSRIRFIAFATFDPFLKQEVRYLHKYPGSPETKRDQVGWRTSADYAGPVRAAHALSNRINRASLG